MQHISLWNLKKLPMEQVIDYIRIHGKPELQARMAGMSLEAYARLDEEAARSSLIGSISSMDDEDYENCLLEIIDE